MALIAMSCNSKNAESKKEENKVATAEKAVELTPELKAGRRLYNIHCMNCHGRDGRKEMTGDYDLFLSTMTLDEIVAVTRDGRTTMMPYVDILTEEQILRVSEYTLTLQESYQN